jgi:predicted transcriptional regulator
MEKTRAAYTTTFDISLLKKLQHLAVEFRRRQNDLLEEAVEDLLIKYESQKKAIKSHPVKSK